MRKSLCAIIAVLMLASLLCGCTNNAQENALDSGTLVSADAEKQYAPPSFTEAACPEALRDAFQNSDVLLFENESASFAVRAGLYAADELETAYYAAMRAIDGISALFGAPELKVCIAVGGTDNGSRVMWDENTLAVSKEAFQNDDYTVDLARLMYGVRSRWFGYGVLGALGKMDADAGKLKSYYKGNDNINMLGLSDARFTDAWCSEEELAIARGTSAALMRFALTNYGADAVLSGISDEIKTEWLKSIGVDKTFSYPYAEYVSNFSLSDRVSSKFPVMLESERDEFDMARIEYYFESAEQVEAFIFSNQSNREAISTLLSETMPDSVEDMDLDVEITYKIYPNRAIRKHGWQFNGIIPFYNDPLYHMHECVHALAGTKTRNHWIDEGIAVYLSCVYVKDELMTYAIYSSFEYCAANTRPTDPDSNWQIDFSAYDYYIEHGGSLSDFDMRLAIDGYAYSANVHPTIKAYQCFSYPTYSANDIVVADRLDGDELSYYSAGSLVAYLIDNYSLESVLSYALLEQDYEAAFGKPYETVISEWTAYIMGSPAA